LTGHFSISRQSSTPPLTPKAESPLGQGGKRETLSEKPLPSPQSILLTNPPTVSSPEVTHVRSSSVQDKLAEAWDAVKNDSKIAKTTQELHTTGVCLLLKTFFLR